MSESERVVWEEYHDRTMGLVIFGLVQIGFGLLALLMIPLTIFGMLMSAQATPAMAQPMATVVPALVIYALLSMLLFTLGVGSLMARRWARSLSLALWSLALVYGVSSMVFMAFMMPLMQQSMAALSSAPGNPSAPPPGLISFMTVFMGVMAFFFGVVLPLPFVLFYRSPHVRVTCEWRDPTPRWTDRVPMPVLIAGLIAIASTTVFVQQLAVASFQLPGFALEGSLGVVIGVIWIALHLAVALGLLRLRMWGWLLAVVISVVDVVTWVWAAVTGDLSSLPWKDYTAGVPGAAEMTKGMAQIGLWWIAGMCVLWLVYVLWLKRYFRTSEPVPATA